MKGTKYTKQEYQNTFKPFLDYLIKQKKKGKTLLVGIQGGQGTGKSTVAKVWQKLLQKQGYTSELFSIDDFYTSYEHRKKLSKSKNPFYTIPRGMPGTHRITSLSNTLTKIKQQTPFTIPTFDKSLYNAWGNVASKRTITTKPDFVFFEGWCVGIPRITTEQLLDVCAKYDINLKSIDPKLTHHKEVLRNIPRYQALWKQLDQLIMLKPDNSTFHFHWRWKQERELIKNTARGMSKQKVQKFVNTFLPWTYACYDLIQPDKTIFLSKQHDFYKLRPKS